MKKLLLLVAPVLMFSNQAFAQSAIEPPLITVTGQAEVRESPDEAVFALVIEAMDKDVLAANKKTDESVKEVLATARRNNIKPEDIQTSQISVQPKYNTDDMEYSERNTVKRVLIGYQVSKTIGIRLRDISRFEVILADVLKAGITQLTNLQFRDSQMRKHKDQARAMAIRAAQEKANLEGNLHATMGFIALNNREYPKAVEHYETALKSIPKDGIAHFRLGLAYQFLTSDASKAVVNAIKAENDAKSSHADQVQIDELVATRQGIEQDLNDKRDKAIDQLATAVAIGGVVQQPARDALTKLYQSKTADGSTAGLEELIAQKKSSL